MSQPGSLTWLARHELRLAWRDFVAMVTAGKPRRAPLAATALLAFVAFLHLVAYSVVAPFAATGRDPDLKILAGVSVAALLSWSLMLSQAMESATRAFYARADFDLLLSSPLSARKLFAVRMAAIAAAATAMAALLVGPFANMLAILDKPAWLAAYGVAAAMGMAATACAVVLTSVLFRTLGPKRTRLAAQIVAAVIGAVFVIGVQAVAILSYGTLSRFAALKSDLVLELAQALEPDSLAWLPARATTGDLAALAATLGAATLALAAAIAVFSGRFADDAAAAAGVAFAPARQNRVRAAFRRLSPATALRRKEWTLLLRDPWLISQTLMQLLYLLPPILLLWRNFGEGAGALVILAPILTMAAGQLAGGLAWLAVSGEDAPDLIAAAPVPATRIVRAKVEAVLGGTALIFLPLVAALALAAPTVALAAGLGVAVAAASSTRIQIWFRAQAQRRHFRRRHTSSRVATFAEAFASTLWATAAGFAAVGSWFAVAPAVAALGALAGARALAPRGSGREPSRCTRQTVAPERRDDSTARMLTKRRPHVAAIGQKGRGVMRWFKALAVALLGSMLALSACQITPPEGYEWEDPD